MMPTDNEADIPEGFKLPHRRKQKNIDKKMVEWGATDKDRLTYQHYMIRYLFHIGSAGDKMKWDIY